MPHPEEDGMSHAQLSSTVFEELLESIIVDVASECHRIARLGLERNLEEEEEELRLSAKARAGVVDSSNSGEANNKYVVDIFGQTHPPVANELFDCMNCGRAVAAGRFALEKCIGKGRKARLKATRSSAAAQGRQSRGSPENMNRQSNGVPGAAGDEFRNGAFENSSR
ncbi:unnamed protein product [Rhodiola kirilowii]